MGGLLTRTTADPHTFTKLPQSPKLGSPELPLQITVKRWQVEQNLSIDERYALSIVYSFPAANSTLTLTKIFQWTRIMSGGWKIKFVRP